ncbi:aldose epimerase [Citrobacter amalonaticus]|uniref:Aldose epimerase n=1 Tax=Citrobacter amalonaticus TaxID=35703 RepID=A0A2S4RSD6_CITAM|nr:aldose epimerase [Citrobacter amalonaticus]POT54900.1 aldose epimerase [Citrobacter amalonaticus]POT70873.1 aldose epimerase [Citrobacter amalonaticus]POU62490.1 aldose epimerase [Citrobacter amalonaticus]POV02928.1 aldose epimerase [Citrobacter amalonaticus]
MKTEWNNAHQQALQRAFDTPWPGPTGDVVSLQKGNIRIQVYPQDGARITSLQAFGYEILRQWEPQRKAFQYGCFPMVPWAGRLGYATLSVGEQRYTLPANKPPHALHGMACYSSWEVVEKTADRLQLRMLLDSPWPWRGEVRQTLILEDDALILRLEIGSESEIFPASAGWHPWFAKHLNHSTGGKELQVLFHADWQEEPGSDELPTGNRIAPRAGPWDDCFGFSSGLTVNLQWPGQLTMLMTSTAQSLVVFDKQPDATCVNPLTQAPNEINVAPQFASPGAPLVIETCWRFKRDV